MAGYSGTPFLKKLGIKEGMRGALMHVPQEVRGLFADAPAVLSTTLTGDLDYVHVFVRGAAELRKEFPRAKKALKRDGMLWVSWPKAGKLGTDLTENVVRDIGLAAGLVDVKVAAIDGTWSGLKFVYRLKDR
jgi:hypothetical protein